MTATSSLGKPRWPLWFWVLSFSAPILFIGAMHQLEVSSALSEDWYVSSLQFVPDSSATPPEPPSFTDPDQSSQTQIWQTISLSPGNASHPEILGSPLEPSAGWFRIILPATKPTPDRWMLVVPDPDGTNYSLWLDGIRYATAGSHDPKSTSMPMNPISLEFPQLALAPASPSVWLKVTSELGGINPAGMYLGPAEELSSYASNTVFMKKTLIRAIAVMMAIMALVVFFIHLARKDHTDVYGWFALSTTVWLLHTLQAQHETADFGSVWFWYRTSYITLAAYVTSSLVFINRLIKRPQPRLEIFLLGILIAGSIFILVDPIGVDGIFTFNKLLWIPATLAGGLYMLVRLASSAYANPERQTLILLAATFLGVCVGIRDYLYNDLQLIPGGMLYLRHAAGLIIIAFSFVMIRRFAIDVQQATRAIPAELGSDSPDASARTPAHTQQALLQQEHDDLEQQLQQAVLNTESTEGTAQFNNNMRAARHDLQLIRDMIDRGEDIPPGELLNTMQLRLGKSAKRQRVPLRWTSPLIDAPEFIKDHYELALARFVQTATLEALAFDSVGEVSVEAQVTSTNRHRMQVTVSATAENGVEHGFSKRAQLEAAARALGGRLSFHRTEQSCEVALSWNALEHSENQ